MRMQSCTLKHFSKFSENMGLAQAWLSTLERTCSQRSSARAWLLSLKRTVNSRKVLDACNSRLMGARPPLQRETQVLARACIPSLERTVNIWKVLDTRISCSSVSFPARAGRMYSECTLEREVLRSSVGPKSGISRLNLQAQIQHLKHQIRFFWANFLKNTLKLIIWHVSKIYLQNQSPKVAQLNTNQNKTSWT